MNLLIREHATNARGEETPRARFRHIATKCISKGQLTRCPRQSANSGHKRHDAWELFRLERCTHLRKSRSFPSVRRTIICSRIGLRTGGRGQSRARLCDRALCDASSGRDPASAATKPDFTVEEFSRNVQMPGMTCRFLDHVQHDPTNIWRFVSPVLTAWRHRQ